MLTRPSLFTAQGAHYSEQHWQLPPDLKHLRPQSATGIHVVYCTTYAIYLSSIYQLIIYLCIYLIVYQPTCTSNLSTWLSIFRHIYLSIYPISILPHQSEMQIQAAWALTLSFEDHHGSGKLPSLTLVLQILYENIYSKAYVKTHIYIYN